MPRKPSWEKRIEIGQIEINKPNPFSKEDIRQLVVACLKEKGISGKVFLVKNAEEIKEIHNKNKLGHIVWIEFVADSFHVAVVGAGKDIGFPHNQSVGTWKILSQIKNGEKSVEWDMSEVIVAVIEGLDTGGFGIKNVNNILKCRNGVEHCIGEYLIEKNVPVINFYSHKNYSEIFWKKCELNNYEI